MFLMRDCFRLSTRIYDVNRLKDYRRMAVFLLRVWFHRRGMQELMRFFQTTPLLREIAQESPVVFEQATRKFFYYRSAFLERSRFLQNHFRLSEQLFLPEALLQIYREERLNLWGKEVLGKRLTLDLTFHSGDKKEGLMTLVMEWGGKGVYRMMFWLAEDKNGAAALWIGALQGTPGGREFIRVLTRSFFGYRPKNLMLYSLRVMARRLEIDRIYAVSNQGFYANNHCRLDRKLKTSLDDFWKETGGTAEGDSRFFRLPVREARKNVLEIPSRKRNLYCKRFDALDQIEAMLEQALRRYVKRPCANFRKEMA